MKISPTELMKKLKYIESEISDIHDMDMKDSLVPMTKEVKEDGTFKLVPLYEREYDFNANREQIENLYTEERKIRNILFQFNASTKVIGYDFTMSEALVRLGQIKKEIRVLDLLASNRKMNSEYRGETISKVTYDIEDAKSALRNKQSELSALQVAIDKTNLVSEIDY